ncbi:LacI family DNA-binding transcriptional regulator [Brachybacterium tyrofermentans]|uniref:LacI family DNA-binding transcriptional regulator n=1 Tax=Brachybacterium tyrofermentans TaxID=47848 RepID=UPI003FD603AF
MATIREVAEAAGVSRMTVSNVINGRQGKVSARTVERVEAVIAATGYVPDESARALSSRSSRIIALLMHHRPGPEVHLANPHDAIFVGSVERAVTAAGFTFIMASAEDVVATARTLGAWRVDGLIVLGSVADEVNDLVAGTDRPVVFVDNYSQDPEVLLVGIDDELGGHLAGAHLITAGHREVAFAGPFGATVGVVEHRLRGLRSAVAQAGVEEPARCVIDVGNGPGDAAHAVAALLAAEPRPTAVLAASDVLAIGLMGQLSDHAIRVPEDMSVIGFDDVPLSALVRPALTTVRQDIAAKGNSAVANVVGRIRGDAVPPTGRADPTLVVRGTVARAPFAD